VFREKPAKLRNLTNPEQAPRLIVGEAVSVNFRGGGTFCSGRIRAVEDKMYDIAFDDGSQEQAPANRLRAGSPQEFLNMGHAVIAPFVGPAGGALAVLFFGRRDGPTTTQPDPDAHERHT
jgi:hypothetical protein